MVKKNLSIKKTNKNIFIVPNLQFKKKHKGIILPQVYNNRLTSIGTATFGIKALESARITYEQTEIIRRISIKKYKKYSVSTKHSLVQQWPVSQKGRGLRMGKGKGAVGYWVNRLVAGKISLFINTPIIGENLQMFKDTYISMKKRLNYKSKFIINKHLKQEYYTNIKVQLNYWKFA